MASLNNLAIIIPESPACQVTSTAAQISDWLTGMGIKVVQANSSPAISTLCLHGDTLEGFSLIITTVENAHDYRADRSTPIISIPCSDAIQHVMTNLFPHLDRDLPPTMPFAAAEQRDEDILIRRLTDLGYL